MRAFADAIKARDGKPMRPCLSEKYVIDDLPAGSNAGDLFSQAIDPIPPAVEIIINSVVRKNDIRTVMIEFRYTVDNVKVKTFRFDASGKLATCWRSTKSCLLMPPVKPKSRSVGVIHTCSQN